MGITFFISSKIQLFIEQCKKFIPFIAGYFYNSGSYNDYLGNGFEGGEVF